MGAVGRSLIIGCAVVGGVALFAAPATAAGKTAELRAVWSIFSGEIRRSTEGVNDFAQATADNVRECDAASSSQQNGTPLEEMEQPYGEWWNVEIATADTNKIAPGVAKAVSHLKVTLELILPASRKLGATARGNVIRATSKLHKAIVSRGDAVTKLRGANRAAGQHLCGDAHQWGADFEELADDANADSRAGRKLIEAVLKANP